jgi:hypothetical protein
MVWTVDCVRVLACLVRLFCGRLRDLGFTYLGGRSALPCVGLPKNYAGDDLSLRSAPQICAVSPVVRRKLPVQPCGRGITTWNAIRGVPSNPPMVGYGRGRALLLALGRGSGDITVRPVARPVGSVS